MKKSTEFVMSSSEEAVVATR